MSRNMHPNFVCFTCSRRFVTFASRRKHERSRHPYGAIWAHDGVTVWLAAVIGLDPSSKYHVICEDHGFCVGVDTKREAMSCRSVDFCEICNGTLEWCRTCGQGKDAYGSCDTHEIGSGTFRRWYMQQQLKTIREKSVQS